jgi:uncharacterized protein YbjT (DUF2867 family)
MSAQGRSIAIVGATGLVGAECLRLLLEHPAYDRVVTLTRRPLASVAGAGTKLQSHVVDFDRLSSYGTLLQVDQVLCALGTTIKKAGSQPAFRKVDFEYAHETARIGYAKGARHFLLVSALGASAESGVFYNRVKGELEHAVLALPYRSHTIIRPSLLVGERAETRFGEVVGAKLGFLVPRKYKPIRATDVARALVAAAIDDAPGTRIIESGEIPRTAR